MLLEARSAFLDSWTSSCGWDNQEETGIEDAVLNGWPKRWWSGRWPQNLLKHKEGSLDEARKLMGHPGTGGAWGCEGRALCKPGSKWGDMWALASQCIQRLQPERNSLSKEPWVGPKQTNKPAAQSSLSHPDSTCHPRDCSTLYIHSGALFIGFQGSPGHEKPEFPQEQWVQ